MARVDEVARARDPQPHGPRDVLAEAEHPMLPHTYRALVERIPGIVYAAAVGEEGSWLYVSPQIDAILGYSPEQWCADPSLWFERLHPADREQAIADEARSRVTGELDSEYRMIARDGRVIWFQDRATLVRDVEGRTPYLQGVMLDVTAHKRAEEELNLRRGQLAEAQRLAHIGSWQWDIRPDHLTWSDELYRIFGIEPSALEPTYQGFLERVHEDDRKMANAAIEAALAERSSYQVECRIVRPDGQERVIDSRGEVIVDATNTPVRMRGTAQDISSRRQAEAALSQSHHQLQSIIDNSPSIIYAKDRSLRYLFVNAGFEHVFGLEPGAAIGKTHGSVLAQQVRERAGESEQRVLETGEMIEQEEVLILNGDEHTFLTQRFPLRNDDGEVYAVCGISTDISERKAEEVHLRAAIDWSNRVRNAVARDGLALHVQPILNLRSGVVEQEELLVRMIGDRGEDDLVMPGQFLPAAERFGLVHEIDRWVVFQAVRLAKDRKVEVNLSGRSIGDQILVSLIRAGLDTQGTDPSNLVFEITETAAAENLELAAAFVQQLTDLGCGFALDDFGTGFGSFNYLKHLPVDYLKIDIEFVRDLESDPSDQKVVRSIVQVAEQFGMRTIGEGVERPETLDMLRSLGVDFAQGYLIGRPQAL